MLPIISVLPLFWRMMQCLKRYYTTRDKVHLPNAGKYAAGLSVVLFSSLMGNFQGTHTGTLAPRVWELPADQRMRHTVYSTYWPWYRVLWLICFIGTTLYNYTWDLFMDWGLGRIYSNNFMLRDRLVWQNHKWVRVIRLLA